MKHMQVPYFLPLARPEHKATLFLKHLIISMHMNLMR